MTLSPPGAKLAPVDLPPPPPSADPREPESTRHSRSRTPQRAAAAGAAGARSPYSSRPSSPTRDSSSPPLLSPKPRTPSRPASVSCATAVGGAATAAAGAAALATSPQSSTGTVGTLSPTFAPTPARHFPASHAHAHAHHPHHPHLSSRPASPAGSIHSSGSAIFERDIEMPAVASLSLNTAAPSLSHKSSRIFHPHGSNLEHTVPAVLDDAVEALTADEPIDALEIEAPAGASTAAMARSPSASFSPALRARVTSFPASASGLSRSPSPETLRTGAATGTGTGTSTGSTAFLASHPISLATALAKESQTSPVSPISIASAMSPVEALSPLSPLSPMSPASPTSATAKATSSATSASLSPPKRPTPTRQISDGPQLPGGWVEDKDKDKDKTEDAPVSASAVPSHLTPTKDTKRRISFISYNDLLLSVPTTVTSLNEITSGTLAPDHLPGTVSPAVVAPRATSLSSIGHAQPLALASAANIPTGLAGAEGEWSREGLGRGLEQRLESLIAQPEGQVKV